MATWLVIESHTVSSHESMPCIVTYCLHSVSSELETPELFSSNVFIEY